MPALAHVLSGCDVGEHVRPPKRVDRLLRVADIDRSALSIDALEDAVLDRIGVLKLVDQRQWVVARDHRGDGLTPGWFVARHASIYGRQEVVEREHARLATSPLRLRLDIGEKPTLEVEDGVVEDRRPRLVRAHEGAARFEERVLRLLEPLLDLHLALHELRHPLG